MTKYRDVYGQEWLEVERLPQALDLSLISRALTERRIPHRITEEGAEQVVWAAREEDRRGLMDLLEAWQRGDVEIRELADADADTAAAAAPAARGSGWSDQAALILRLLPVTSLLLVLSVLGYLVVFADARLQIGHWFTIVDIGLHRGAARVGDIDGSEIWRVWTPMFLHFDLIHIAFNALFLWVFGARIERVMGSGRFLLFVLAAGAIANLGQLMWESNPRFGGMSGVNYGFIGYIWLRQLLAPHPMLVFPKALIPMLLLMLLLGTVGALDVFIEGRVANAAHVTGLMVGISWGLLAGLANGRRRGADEHDP
ncbi:rhomboid family intramembrane serine protease [Gilvimarinus sp. F26214L]|uniref:rhomboid family intramembrane serine protease n=1 Tax=Gilvimarinus sp. DZF01 TaxID=3461371 RepID=UPI004045EA75